MSHRRLLVLALIAGLPGIAGAQFTTFIPPQNKLADSVKAIVVAQKEARADSVVATRITNMKTWVDSAAGITAIPMTAADSLATAPVRTDTASMPAMPAKPVMRNGAPAPATASALPLVALIGVGALVAGALLVGGPTPAKVRSNSRARDGA